MCQSGAWKYKKIRKTVMRIECSFKMQIFMENGEIFWAGASCPCYRFGRDVKILGTNPAILPWLSFFFFLSFFHEMFYLFFWKKKFNGRPVFARIFFFSFFHLWQKFCNFGINKEFSYMNNFKSNILRLLL